jgi:hypothetical protein
MATVGDTEIKPDHIIIWCDQNIGEEENNRASKAILAENADLNRTPSSEDSSDIYDFIYSINPYLNIKKREESPLRMFTNENECIKYIYDSIQAKKQPFVITSGQKGALIVPQIYKKLSGYIYVFCAQRNLHEQWTGPYEKDIEIYDDEKGVFAKVLLDIGIYYLKKGQNAIANPASATLYFYWAKRLIKNVTKVDGRERDDYLKCIEEELSDLSTSRSGYLSG